MITSPHNQILKDIRRLQRRRGDGRFVAEGEDLVEAAEAAGWTPVASLRSGVDVEPSLLDDVSAMGSGTRVIAIFEERWSSEATGLCVALWGVRDPGNVGTVLRSAAAFGAASVAIGPGTADPFGPKAARASMGAIFSVPVVRVANVSDLPALPAPRLALAAREGEPLHDLGGGPAGGDGGTAGGDGGTAIGSVVVGAEREGLPAEVAAACERTAHIPIATESLNAAMAATVALYALTRIAAA